MRYDVIYALSTLTRERNTLVATLYTQLLPLMQATAPQVRVDAIRVLSECCHARAVPAVLAAMHDPDLSVRQAAVTALEAMGSYTVDRTRIIDALRAAGTDIQAGVRQQALKALGRFQR